MGTCSSPFPVVRFLDVEGETVVLAQHCQVPDPLPVGCLIAVCDQVYHRCVVSKLNDGVGVVRGHTVVCLNVLIYSMFFLNSGTLLWI